MVEQPKPTTGYPAASSQYPTGYPPPQPYASVSNGYAPSGYAPSGYPPSGYAPSGYPPPSYYPPPPPPQPNQAYYYGGNGGCRMWPFFRRLIIATIAVVLIVGVFFFTIGFIFRPRIPGFSVNAVSVHQFNISGGQLTANWDVTFAVDNRDKRMGISYGQTNAYVFYNEDKLADTSLAPFYQEKKNSTTLRASFATVSTFVSDSSKLTSERSAGQVHFGFRILSVVQFQSGGWWTGSRPLVVRCSDVEIDFPSSATNGTGGTLKSPSRCSVYM